MLGGYRLRQAALANVRQAHLQTAGEQGLNVLSKTAMLRGRGARRPGHCGNASGSLRAEVANRQRSPHGRGWQVSGLAAGRQTQ